MLQFLTLLVLVTLMTFDDVVNSSCTGGSVDGCSTPKYTPYKKKFTPSCNRHDVCYACGVQYGKSRKWCDSTFKDNMKETCGKNIVCKTSAYTYYKAVALFGSSRYHSTAESWCGQSWVQGCL